MSASKGNGGADLYVQVAVTILDRSLRHGGSKLPRTDGSLQVNGSLLQLI